MNESAPQPILNPTVYLNYLQPTTANEYEITRNVFLVTFGALIWDILSSLPSDWIIIRATKPTPVLFAYLSSRICALAVVFTSAFASVGPVQNCSVIGLVLCIFFVFSSGSSSYLFLIRVHTVFFQERLVCHAFTALWVAGVAASMMVFPGLLHVYYEIVDTGHCNNLEVRSYVSVAFIVPVAFDVLVYVAISVKILMFHPRITTKPASWKSFCLGKDSLPRLSRSVLQGGQQYYTITTGVNITRSVFALSTNVSPALQLLPSVPALALTSVMACRVFRILKLEGLQKTEAAILTTIHFADGQHDNVQSVQLPKNTEPAFTEAGMEQC